MLSVLLILCHFLFLLLSIFPSIRVFSNESALCIRWPKYWNFYSGLISFRIDWFDLEVQGTLKSLLQHYNLKASILCHSAFFMVQLPHPCMTTGKTIALTIWSFVGKVTTLLFNMVSRFIIALLSRGKCLLVLWLQSLSTGILQPKKIKSVTASTFSPSVCHEVMRQDAMILIFWMLSFKPVFSLSSSTLLKRLSVPLYFLPLEWHHLHIGCWYGTQQSWFQLVIPPAWHFSWRPLHID